MINPSARGWIAKFLQQENKNTKISFLDFNAFYKATRKSGFVFSHIVSVHSNFDIAIQNLMENEIAKLALFSNLYHVFKIKNQQATSQLFIDKVVDFYQKINAKEKSIFDQLIIENDQNTILEDFIDDRIEINTDVFSKKFSYILINALLFVDVLAFEIYLEKGQIPDKYLSKIENKIVNLITISLRAKSTKSEYDDLLLKFFELSVRYTKFSSIEILKLDELEFDECNSPLTALYFLDITVLAIWSDSKLENEEFYFLHQLTKKLKLTQAQLQESIDEVNFFIQKNKSQISYFNYASPLKHFYDYNTNLVGSLLQRNKKRLAKEVLQSKELLVLLIHSTKRDLNKEEKKKVKKQLLDICKTIPSLTIFLVPGGSLLLPFLIKFIPSLLPSSFNENLEND